MDGNEGITMNTTATDLATVADDIHVRQVIVVPCWVNSDKFDIRRNAKRCALPNQNQFRTLFQKLLPDRFSPAFHHDKRELTVYAVMVAKMGRR